MRKTFIYKGKRYSVQSKFAKTKDDLDKLVEQKKKEIDEITEKFSNFAWEWYRTFKEPYVSQSTRGMYRSSLNTLCKYLGDKSINKITAADIQKVITAEMTSKSKVDKIILTVRQIGKSAGIEWNIIRPKIPERKIRALTKCEERVIREACKTSRYGIWILTMLYLGLRPSETARLKVKDIGKGYIHVRGTKSPKADRYIPVPEALIFDLSDDNPESYVFYSSQPWKPLNRQNIDRWWAYFKRDLDLYMNAPTYRNKIMESYITPDITLYSLRHTFGTRAQQAGVPIDVLADLMGHEKIETTRKYYITDNLESKERQRDKLNSMWT